MFTKVTAIEWKDRFQWSRVKVTRYKLLGVTIYKVITPIN